MVWGSKYQPPGHSGASTCRVDLQVEEQLLREVVEIIHQLPLERQHFVTGVGGTKTTTTTPTVDQGWDISRRYSGEPKLPITRSSTKQLKVL